MSRKYIPAVGDHIKLKAMWNYNDHGISMWAWLKVIRMIPGDNQVFVRVLNGMEETEQTAMLPLGIIQPPIGWKPIYTITCKDADQASKILHEWFKRGIHVWASHDLSSAGRMAFTPVKELADLASDEPEPNSPHWQYTGNPVETILAADCARYFRVEVLHQWEPELPPTAKKAARQKAIAVERAMPGVELFFMADGCGGKIAVCERIEVIYEPSKH